MSENNKKMVYMWRIEVVFMFIVPLAVSYTRDNV